MIDLAAGAGVGGGVIKEDGEDVAGVVLPIGEFGFVIEQVINGVVGGGFGLDGIFPIPVVSAPSVVDIPGGEEVVAKIGDTGGTGIEEGVLLAGVTEADELVKEGE